jgi:hypothetical protein
MSGVFPQLVFLSVGGSIAPPLLLLTILFLSSQRPLPNATALTPGYFTTCAVMGIAGLALFGGAAGAGGVASVIGRAISATVGGLLIAWALADQIGGNGFIAAFVSHAYEDLDCQPTRGDCSVAP